jgi:3-phenylpropionate/trans-cinnamate dioxygenase ferredoxin reductase subunit
MASIIVIGAGQAAAAFAAKFRTFDTDTPITIIGDEPSIPYQRPPLSKKYATGDMTLAQLNLRPAGWYGDKNVDLVTHTSVVDIDRDTKIATLSDGTQRTWSKLVFATGSRVRELPDAVTKDLRGIHYLRTLADADVFGAALRTGKRVLIVGGGYIGLEAAAVCATKGMDVTLVEASKRILQRVACTETSDWFRALHRAHGVTLHEGLGLSHFGGKDGELTSAVMTDGSVIDADIAVVGIGIIPNDTLAQSCGLEVANGIVVDAFCQTSDPDIYAAGDCAVAPYRDIPTRLESVPNAIDQANIAAENIANATATPYVAKPWFWSDQYDVKLQIAGLNRGYDTVVTRAGDTARSMAHFYYKDGQLLAIDAMNAPRVYMIGKRLLEAGKSISPDHAGDVTFDLKSLL